MPYLTSEQFIGTYCDGMKDVTGEPLVIGVVDLASYVRHIPVEDWQGHGVGDSIHKTFENDRFRHVLVKTDTLNVYMVVVVRRDADLVKGHHLLDMRAETGPAGEGTTGTTATAVLPPIAS
jgi:hypothetical protein